MYKFGNYIYIYMYICTSPLRFIQDVYGFFFPQITGYSTEYCSACIHAIVIQNVIVNEVMQYYNYISTQCSYTKHHACSQCNDMTVIYLHDVHVVIQNIVNTMI